MKVVILVLAAVMISIVSYSIGWLVGRLLK